MAGWSESSGLVDLTSAQRLALAQIHDVAEMRRLPEMDRLAAYGLTGTLLSHALEAIQRCPVALHFHPDRVGRQGLTVADDLLASGLYKSQFETGISSGSVSAHPGGERHYWESVIFGSAYDGTQADERPKYGAIDLFGHHNGPAPRFGSCAFLLKPEVNCRSTFCAGDSHVLPETWGVFGNMEGIVAKAAGGTAGHLSGEDFIGFISNMHENRHAGKRNRELDHYIEAQVHGPVRIEKDVLGLTCDQSFRNSTTGEKLEMIAIRSGFPIFWQPPFRLKPETIPAEFRGAEVPLFAARIARDGWIDASDVGRAMISDNAALDSFHKSRQNLVKKLWHALAVFGEETLA